MRRGPKPGVSWTTATLNQQSTAASNLVFFDVLGGLTLGEKHEIDKVVAVHGRFTYAADAGTLHAFGKYGLIVQNDDVIAVGGAGITDPVSDGDASWMWHDSYETEIDNAVGHQEHQFSPRSTRNIPKKFSLIFALETGAGGTNTHWSVALRVLLRHR